MQTIDEALEKLSKSKFRSSFHLKEKDIEYINKVGMDKIKQHAKDFIKTRLAPKYIPNDGKTNTYERSSCFHCTTCLWLLL